MKTIDTSICVNPDGSAVIELKLPNNIAAGVHRAIVIVEDQQETHPSADASGDLLPMTFEGWPENCSFRREELYGDDGR